MTNSGNAAYPGTGNLLNLAGKAATTTGGAFQGSPEGTALYCNGSSTYARYNDSLLNSWAGIDNNAISMGIRFCPNGIQSGWTRLLEKGANSEFVICFFSDGINRMSFQMPSGDWYNNQIATSDNWYSIVWTLRSQMHGSPWYFISNIYCNGQQILTNSQVSWSAITPTGDVNIGIYGGGGYFFNGLISCVALWNRELSPQESINWTNDPYSVMRQNPKVYKLFQGQSAYLAGLYGNPPQPAYRG
jgi:hypothetical protein